MQPALLLLILITLRMSLPVSGTLRLRNREPPLPRQSSWSTGTQGGSLAGMRRLVMELNGMDRRHSDRHFLVTLPVKTAQSHFVSIFDMRRKCFLCMNSKGELYNSRQMEWRDCLFQHRWSSNHQNVRNPLSGGRLLQVERAKKQAAQREPPEPSSNLPERLLIPMLKRQKRGDEVNPSDPLQTETHPSKDLKDVEQSQPEQDQAGAVSKETITSCDDPLRVLQPNAPISPVKDNIADQGKQD